MLLLDAKAVPQSVRDARDWRLRTAAGLRMCFWALWLLWFARIYGFFTGAVLPLVTPKLKLGALATAHSYAEPVALAAGLLLLMGAVRTCAAPPQPLLEGALQERFMNALRRLAPIVWALWLLLGVILWTSDLAGYEVAGLVHVLTSLAFAAGAALLLGHLSRLSRALGQPVMGVIAAMMAVYVVIPIDLATIGYGLIGTPEWKQWLPVLSTGRFASWVVAFGGGLVVCGRVRRLLLAANVADANS